MLRKTG